MRKVLDTPEIFVKLDEMLAKRNMTQKELAKRIGCADQNLSKLMNGRSAYIGFQKLFRLCAELHCQPGDLIEYIPSGDGGAPGGAEAEPKRMGSAGEIRGEKLPVDIEIDPDFIV